MSGHGGTGRTADYGPVTLILHLYCAPVVVAEYCDERVCLFVYSVHVRFVCPRAHRSPGPALRSTFTECFVHGRGSVLLSRRCECDALCISVFMDDIIFAHNELAIWGMSMPLQRVTSLRRRAQQANALATSYWLRRVLDNGGR